MSLKCFITICISFVISCSPLTYAFAFDGDQNDAIKRAIHDFLKSRKLSEVDSIFSIYIENINEDILGISIGASDNSILVFTEDCIEYSYQGFPTMYYEENGKLFYWDDSTKYVSNEIINDLTRYNHIDTIIMNVYIPERLFNDAKKVADYYFCKNNFHKFKRVITTKAIGYYEPPKLKCK